MITVDDMTLNNMEEAYVFLKKKYEDKDWDIWIENGAFGRVIYIENIYNAISSSATLYTLDEVQNFINEGGLG